MQAVLTLHVDSQEDLAEADARAEFQRIAENEQHRYISRPTFVAHPPVTSH